jgi:trypsin
MSSYLMWFSLILFTASTLAFNEKDGIDAIDVLLVRNSTSKIVGGNPVSKGIYPSFVHVIGTGTLCGASLIHPDILLTAAHCIASFPENRRLAIGSTFRNGSDATEILSVVSTYQHPQYDAKSMTYDIMLVKMSSLSTAPILQINRNSTKPFDGERMKIMGFGSTSFSGPVSNKLLDAEVNVVSYETCSSNYNNFLIKNESMVCASALNTDSCRGDSGGPLLDVSTNTIIGVVSFGDGCAKIDKPGVYARVSAAVNFIDTGICIYSNIPPIYCDKLTYAPTVAPTLMTKQTLPPTKMPTTSTLAPILTTKWTLPPTNIPTKMPTTSTLAPSANDLKSDCDDKHSFPFFGRRIKMHRQSLFSGNCISSCTPAVFRFFSILIGWKMGSCS